MSIHDHAWREFKAAGWLHNDGVSFKDEMQEMICRHVLKLLDVFHNEGHSGSTAPYTIELFSKLAKFDPIVPLTGNDDEWNEVREGVWQNKRCSEVFKQSDRFNGQPYYLDAIVFWEWVTDCDDKPMKAYYTSAESMQPIVFPYEPKTVYQFVPNEQFPNEFLYHCA